MKKILFAGALLIAVLTFAACGTVTTTYYTKSGLSEEEFMRDRSVCLQESQETDPGSYVNAYGRGSAGAVKTNHALYKACMEGRGYSIRTE